jgi:hypothetical protein
VCCWALRQRLALLLLRVSEQAWQYSCVMKQRLSAVIRFLETHWWCTWMRPAR